MKDDRALAVVVIVAVAVVLAVLATSCSSGEESEPMSICVKPIEAKC